MENNKRIAEFMGLNHETDWLTPRQGLCRYMINANAGHCLPTM
jgi:hypothetical protein